MNKNKIIGLLLASSIAISTPTAKDVNALDGSDFSNGRDTTKDISSPIMSIPTESIVVKPMVSKYEVDSIEEFNPLVDVYDAPCELGLNYHHTTVGTHAKLDFDLRKVRLAKEEKERQEKLEQERKKKEEEARIAEEQRIERERVANVSYNPNDLTHLSGINYDEMYTILSGTNMVEVANALVDAERVHGVNAIFMAGLAALESGWNTSYVAKTNNNLTGMAMYSSSSIGYIYNSKYDNIMDTARQIKNNYLNPDGPYFNGYSSSAVEVRYCEKKDWNEKIDRIANELIYEYDANFRNES